MDCYSAFSVTFSRFTDLFCNLSLSNFLKSSALKSFYFWEGEKERGRGSGMIDFSSAGKFLEISPTVGLRYFGGSSNPVLMTPLF